jgi:exonuclease SbcC
MLAESLARAQSALDAAMAAVQSARSRRDQALVAEHVAREAADDAAQAAATAKELFERRKQAHLDLEGEARTVRSEVAQFTAQLDRALTGVCNWRELADGEHWLRDTCGQWRELTVSAETAATRVSNAKVALAEALIGMRTLRDRLEAARKSHEAAQTEASERGTERAALLGGEAVVVVNARLAETARKLELARTQARDVLSASEQTRSATRARLTQSEDQVESAAVILAEQTRDLAAQLASDSILETDVARVAAAGSAALDAEADALGQIEQAASSFALLLGQRQADLARHQANEAPELLGEALSQALDTARVEVQAADTHHRDLHLQLREDDAVRDRTAALRSDLEAANSAATLWLTLDALIGDATGKKFRNFAQGLTLDRLLVHANARLADLKPRYSLARGEGGDMIIEVIDNDMAGQIRGLHNLSGGERFLVSLALALGLAEMSTARGMRIESLFIDEGFGALDPDSLGQALALLEHLHAGGRRVGVISHVEELKERIAAKVEVTPTGRGTSELRVLVSG